MKKRLLSLSSFRTAREGEGRYGPRARGCPGHKPERLCRYISADFSKGQATFEPFGFNVDSIDPDYLSLIAASAVPLPAAVWLLASGLPGIIGMARCGRAVLKQ
jgi:hypothetical protein